jgi:hypothetical protein
MFGWFKRKKRDNLIDRANSIILFDRANNIISKYTTLLNEIDPTSFYDTKSLPYTKGEICRALILSYKIQPDPHSENFAKSGLIMLTRFQDNVGPEPIRPMHLSMGEMAETQAAGDLLIKAMTRTNIRPSEKTCPKWEVFNNMAKAEEKHYMEILTA